MRNARKPYPMQSAVGSATSVMQMRRITCETWTHGFAVASVCAYGRVGRIALHASATSSNAGSQNGAHINGEMRAKDIGPWQVALCKSQ